MVKQIACRSDDQLHRTFWQEAGFDHDPHSRFGKIGGRCGRLGDDRHTSEQGGGHFFEHAPNREIKSIDQNGGAVTGGVNMLADECAMFGKAFRRAVQKHGTVG